MAEIIRSLLFYGLRFWVCLAIKQSDRLERRFLFIRLPKSAVELIFGRLTSLNERLKCFFRQDFLHCQRLVELNLGLREFLVILIHFSAYFILGVLLCSVHTIHRLHYRRGKSECLGMTSYHPYCSSCP